MGGNNEFFENFERNKYLKKLPSMQRVNQGNDTLWMDHNQFHRDKWRNLVNKFNINTKWREKHEIKFELVKAVLGNTFVYINC